MPPKAARSSKAAAPVAPPLSSHVFGPDDPAATFALFARKAVPPPPPPVPSQRARREALLALTARELRETCHGMDLKGYGNKEALVDRIVTAEPQPTAELLAAEAEARRAARAVMPTPRSEWYALGEILIPEVMVDMPGYLEGAVFERQDALCSFAKRLHMSMFPFAEDEALEFGTKAAGEVRLSNALSTSDVLLKTIPIVSPAS